MRKIGYRQGIVSESVLIGDYKQERLEREREYDDIEEGRHSYRQGKVVKSEKPSEVQDGDRQLYY
jgi:hypothetical protein